MKSEWPAVLWKKPVNPPNGHSVCSLCGHLLKNALEEKVFTHQGESLGICQWLTCPCHIAEASVKNDYGSIGGATQSPNKGLLTRSCLLEQPSNLPIVEAIWVALMASFLGGSASHLWQVDYTWTLPVQCFALSRAHNYMSINVSSLPTVPSVPPSLTTKCSIFHHGILQHVTSTNIFSQQKKICSGLHPGMH